MKKNDGIGCVFPQICMEAAESSARALANLQSSQRETIMISAEKQLQLCLLVAEALELEPEPRSRFLDDACKSDEERQEVDRILAEQSTCDDSFLEVSVVEQLWPGFSLRALVTGGSQVAPDLNSRPWAPWAACI